MKLIKPIFIIGAGRSGSTIFFDLFSKHPELAWLSGLCNKFPNQIKLNRLLMWSLSTPILGPALLNNVRLGGGEVYGFWRAHAPGFDQPGRDLVESDVHPSVEEKLPSLFKCTLTKKRHRFMTKLTGWSRIRYLNKLFPDAQFIHVIRDGRAVASSYLNVDFWRGWDGPDHWRWGPLTSEQQQRWDAVNQAPIALAALNWEILMDSVDTHKTILTKDRYLEVHYEELCQSPKETMTAVLNFCALEKNNRFLDTIQQTQLKNTNHKYKTDLSQEDQQALEATLKSTLPKYGYA